MADQKPPLKFEAVKAVKARAAKADKLLALRRSFFVTGSKDPPRVKTKVTPLDKAVGSLAHYRIDLEVDDVRLGERAFAPPVMGKAFKQGMPRSSDAVREKMLAPFVPDHLALSTVPRTIVPARRMVFTPDKDIKRPTTVFPPDDRQIFQDTSYPWSTVGLVETPHGTGSGVMIGPRHILTVSHVIDWNPPPPFAANWVKFTPSYFDGNEPFGHAFSTNIYWFNKDSGDNSIDSTEEQFDYVVVVMDSRIGEQCGWMGARGYSDSWDGLTAWSHMGYPGDLNNGQRPCFQGNFSMDGSDSESDDHEAIMHQADVFPGQSGGPMFGWWDGENFPRAVGVQSWQLSGTNGASGGGDLDELVIQAKTDFP